MFERRLYHHLDWLLIGAVLALCAIGLAMIYSTTGGAGRVYWTQVYALGLGLVAMARRLAVDYRSLADKSHWIYLGADGRCSSACCSSASVRGGSRRWLDLGAFNLQPSEFAKAALALMLAKMLGEEPAAGAHQQRSVHRRRADGGAVPASSRASPTSGTAVTLLPILLRRGVRRRHADEILYGIACSSPCSRRRSPGSSRCRTIRSERIATFLDPEQDPRGRRLPADPGAHHRRLRRRVGQGLHAGHAGPAALPAGRAQRLHLLGAGRGAGVRRRARRARAVPVRDHARARRGPAGQGPPRRVSGAGRARQLHVPGHLQHHHVGGSGAGQGTHAAAHELRRLLHDRDAGRLRAHPQRAGCAALRTSHAATSRAECPT